MQQISSSHYPLTRKLVPALKQRSVLGTAVAFLILLIVTGFWLLLLAPLLFLLLIAAIHHAPNIVLQNFCKDAWMDDSGFLLQLKEEQIRIAFPEVEKITWHGSNNPPRAKIHLKTAPPRGVVYTFVPDLKNGREQAKKNVELLNEKIL